MSKTSLFSKTLKMAARMLVGLAKIIAFLVPHLARKLINLVSKRLKFSITFKTVTIYAFIFSVIFLILSLVMVASFGGFLVYQTQNSLNKSAGFTKELIMESTAVPEAQIKKFAKMEGVTISLVNQNKEIISSTDDNNNPPGGLNRDSSGLFLANGRVYLNYPVRVNAAVNSILVSKALDKEIMYLLALLLALTIGFILAVLFMVTTSWKTLKKMLKPIDNMIGTARSISLRDLHTRLNVVDSHDELKELAETFNEMLDRIQVSYDQQNRFVSDASHELRTPIAVIQGYANLLQRWGKEERAILDESVAAIKNEADNMQILVERLLFLARADKDSQKVEKTAFSLNDLIDEVVKETRLIDSQHQVSGETNAPVTLVADRGLLKQAVRIFIDNSIKFTPPGGTIKICGSLKDQRVKIIVEDNGVGIPGEDLPYVFDRFYKCDKSRVRESGGAGLGLSIAKWIVEKHGGAIDIESVLNKGTKIIIMLPV